MPRGTRSTYWTASSRRALGRRLPTVVDTLGLDPALRARWLAAARAAGMPAVAVVFTTEPSTCRRRNAARDIPVPAAVLRAQHAKVAAARAAVDAEGWDQVVEIDASDVGRRTVATHARGAGSSP